MEIRKTGKEDISAVAEIYAKARAYMRSQGNDSQWLNGYPEDQILPDIEKAYSYVMVDEKDCPHAVFAFVIGEDPTYRKIEDGEWLNSEPYGTIHRLAGDGTFHGVFSEVVAFCETEAVKKNVYNLRGDTHKNNWNMQGLLMENGFVRTGTIYVEDGSPRFAYQKVLR